MRGAFPAALYFVVLVLVATVNVGGKIAVQKRSCDIFQGNWVSDNSYPLYNSSQCSFMQDEFNCDKNGRPDKDYMKYKWKPTRCNLPRFNAVQLLRKLKGKKLMFVGDSLSLNQWQSLTCMIHVALPKANYTSRRTTNGLSTFTFPAYNVSFNFYRNGFLVDIEIEPTERVLRLDSITNSKIWERSDLLIFNSWHWWLHSGRQQPWDRIVYGNTTVSDMDRLSAYEKALNTWARWIDSNIDPTKTQVFFQGVSPDHASGQGSTAKNCAGQTQPLKGPISPHPAQVVLEKVLGAMSKTVNLLNITTLSQLRIDGHPSIYGFGGSKGNDCSHWCLSGVPDIWNELLFAMLS